MFRCLLPILLFASALKTGSASAGDPLSESEISMVNAVLANINCRIKPEDIQKQGGDYVLNNAFCADGQFDFRLDANFKIIEKRPE